MITIEKSNQIQKNLDKFYKAILPSEKSQYKKSMRIMATSEDSFYRDVSKPFLDYMRLKIVRDIRRAVIKAKTTPTLFTEFVDWEDISTKGKQLSKPAYVKILEKSGNQAAVVARVEAGFDVMNVNSIKWAEKYTAEMVTEVTKETKKALREVISDGMKQKWNKLKIARRINKMPIGLSLPQTKALNNFRDKLISDGASAKLIDKRVQSYYNRLLRQRSRSIARTETSRAVNEGYLQGLEQQNVYRRVKMSMAADACHLCTEHAGRIFTLEEAHAFLPIHPNCRCAWVVVWSKRPKQFAPPLPAATSSKPKPVERRDHLGGDMVDDKAINMYMNEAKANGVKISLEEARETYKAVRSYTGLNYGKIRAFEHGGIEGLKKWIVEASGGGKDLWASKSKDIIALVKNQSKQLSNFIKYSTKYNDDMIFRGINIGWNDAKLFKEGQIIDMGGVSSWSSERSVAKNFGNVIFRFKNKAGTSIQHISPVAGEKEVLIANQTKFKIGKIYKSVTSGDLNIFLEEIPVL